MKLLFVLVFFLAARQSLGYVENTLKGYANCMACHHSPSGGGILTPYGRSLSSEMMSTFKTEKFQDPFFGLVRNSENLQWGGDIRAVQINTETDQLKRGRLFLMQRNIEVMARQGNVAFIGTLGTQEGPKEVPEKGKVLSERHYALWSVSEDTRLRIGKFRLVYGLNDPNHTRLVKEKLGFGSYSETYQLELSKFYEWGELFISADLGKMDPALNNEEKRFSSQLTFYRQENSRHSINVLRALDVQKNERTLFGVNGIFPVFGSLYSSYQLDFIDKKVFQDRTSNSQGTAGFFNLGSQIVKGIWPYLVYEFYQEDLEKSDTQISSPGVGVRALPVAHFEVQAEYQAREIKQSSKLEQRGWVMVHIYL